jgi:hypothetical protein
MPSRIVACPNPACGASLKLSQAQPPGGRLRCPRCGQDFAAPAEAAPPAEAGAIGLAPEAEQRCPSCQAAMAPNAVLCLECGFNRRTGEKLKTVKKAPRSKPGGPGDGPLTAGDLPAVLNEANKLIKLARKELWRLPRVLGLGDAPDLFRIRAGSPDRCANPNCFGGHETFHSQGRRRSMASRVRVQARGQSVMLYLCQTCTESFQAEKATKKDVVRNYLEEARGDLERAAMQFRDDPGIQQAFEEIRKVEKEAGVEDALGRKRWICFVATAAYGVPFADEVETLRRFRDQVLARSPLGRALVRAYETLSPPLAALIAARAWARALARFLLRPVVACCRRWLRIPPPCR